uniref:Putative transposable element n=1 Tax=Ixodes ricinus TaxID=34613 RepID=A0A0K8REG0_IXORI
MASEQRGPQSDPEHLELHEGADLQTPARRTLPRRTLGDHQETLGPAGQEQGNCHKAVLVHSGQASRRHCAQRRRSLRVGLKRHFLFSVLLSCRF